MASISVKMMFFRMDTELCTWHSSFNATRTPVPLMGAPAFIMQFQQETGYGSNASARESWLTAQLLCLALPRPSCGRMWSEHGTSVSFHLSDFLMNNSRNILMEIHGTHVCRAFHYMTNTCHGGWLGSGRGSNASCNVSQEHFLGTMWGSDSMNQHICARICPYVKFQF